MSSKSFIITIGLFIVILCSCAEKPAEHGQLVLQSEYQLIGDIISKANCDGPFGKYTTEIHSLEDGSCFFRQEFGDTIPPFLVSVDSENSAYLLNEEDEVMDTLAPQDVEMIRGHEMHKMAASPDFFFDELSFENQIKYQDRDYDLFKGKDGLKNTALLYYEKENQRIDKIQLLNPRDTTETIEIIYSNWQASEYGEMAEHITIVQAKKDTFYFDFVSLEVREKTGS